jgi:putative oxidoreductase
VADQINVAMLALRIALGIVFLAHGVKHARGRVKTSNWFESIGFRQPQLQWFLSTATEIGVGVLLIAGALTSLAAAGLIGVMTVAFWTVHRKVGFWITARPDEGWEYVFILTVAAFVVAIVGPGEWSVDGALDIAAKLDGWVGFALGVGAIIVAFLQLATFWRPSEVAATN